MPLTLKDIEDIVGAETYQLFQNEGQIEALQAYIESDNFYLTKNQLFTLFGEASEEYPLANGVIAFWVSRYSIDNLLEDTSALALYILLNDPFEHFIRTICNIEPDEECRVTENVVALAKAYISVKKPEILNWPDHIQLALSYFYTQSTFLAHHKSLKPSENEPISTLLKQKMAELIESLEQKRIINFDEFSKLTSLQKSYIFNFFNKIENASSFFATNKEIILKLDEMSFVKLISLADKESLTGYLKRDKTLLPTLLNLNYANIVILLDYSFNFFELLDENRISMEDLFSLTLLELTQIISNSCSPEAEAIFSRFNSVNLILK
ncbi:MAG: hypothetical protein LCH30_01065 [Proteobacteria bacterium]|nr:hypothetical protein [Pseudomonadota bacterium]